MFQSIGIVCIMLEYIERNQKAQNGHFSQEKTASIYRRACRCTNIAYPFLSPGHHIYPLVRENLMKEPSSERKKEIKQMRTPMYAKKKKNATKPVNCTCTAKEKFSAKLFKHQSCPNLQNPDRPTCHPEYRRPWLSWLLCALLRLLPPSSSASYSQGRASYAVY